MKILVLIVILAFLTSPLTAHAYLDLGTGSLIVQVVLAFLFGVGYLTKVYWRKIKTVFSKRSVEPDENEKE